MDISNRPELADHRVKDPAQVEPVPPRKYPGSLSEEEPPHLPHLRLKLPSLSGCRFPPLLPLQTVLLQQGPDSAPPSPGTEVSQQTAARFVRWVMLKLLKNKK